MSDNKQTDVKLMAKALKHDHQVHILKIQHKVDGDTELLETLRDYAHKRAEIDAQYGKSLDKLAKSLLQKKFRKYLGRDAHQLAQPGTAIVVANNAVGNVDASPDSAVPSAESPVLAASEVSAPNAPTAIDSSHRLVCLALTSMLAEVESESAKRIKLASDLETKVADCIKDFAKERAICSKKNIDFAVKYHQEMGVIYDELDRKKIAYERAAKDCDQARKKYEDFTKKPKGGLAGFKALVTGKDTAERTMHLSRKYRTKARFLNDCRNDYLLAIESSNALHEKYYKDDLVALMKKMDGSVYVLFDKLFATQNNMESELIDSIQESSIKVANDAAKISREKDVLLFLSDFASSFKEPHKFEFEAGVGDSDKTITVDEVTKITLGQLLGIFMEQDDVFSATQTQLEKEFDGVTLLVQAYKETPQFGSTVSPVEQLIDIQNQIDAIKCQRWCLLAQIKMLEDSGILSIEPATLEVDKTVKGKMCKSHTAANDTELSVSEGEPVVILENDSNGFSKVTVTKTGATGLVPTASTVAITSRDRAQSVRNKSISPGASMNVKALYDYKSVDETELSFSAGDVIEVTEVYSDEDWWVGKLARTGATGAFPVNFTSDWRQIAAMHGNSGRKSSSMSPTRKPAPVLQSTDEIAETTAETTIATVKSAETMAKKKPIGSARAIYAYTSTNADELTIVANEIIQILTKDTGSDGWWEGRGHNGTGQFPSSYVEETSEDTPRSAHNLERFQVKALYDFAPTSEGEIGFKTGDVIEVTQSAASDWWDGSVGGKSGAFPASYVEKISE